MTISQLKNKIFEDKNGKVVLGQMPNVYIYVWAIARVAQHFVHNQRFGKFLWWSGTLALLVWASLELTKGVNYFRKALGLIIFIMIIISIFKELA